MIVTYSLKRRAWTVYRYPRGGITFAQLTDYHPNKREAIAALKEKK